MLGDLGKGKDDMFKGIKFQRGFFIRSVVMGFCFALGFSLYGLTIKVLSAIIMVITTAMMYVR